MSFSLIVTLCAFMISLVGTRLLILAFRKRTLLMDIPNARSNHKTPVSRGGGLAVLTAIVIALNIVETNYSLLVSIILLGCVSLLDDLLLVPAWIRFVVQIIAVAIMLSFLPIDFFAGAVSPLVQKILIGIAWVWFINLFNFMDGIDGITTAEMISIGMCLTFVAVFSDHFPGVFASNAMILAAAGCGFMWWNWHPAKIFLGDVGSIPIGFVSFYLLLCGALDGYVYAAFLIPAYYVSDASYTLLRRLCSGQKIWHAHSEHCYQRAVRSGWRHDVVVRYIVGVNILLGFLAVYTVILPDWAIVFLALGYACVFMLMGVFSFASQHKNHGFL